MGILLDTHVWLWYLEGDRRHLSQRIRRRLQTEAKAGRLVVCDISFWEIANKAARGKITLRPTLTEWLASAEAKRDFVYLPLDRRTLIFSTQLRGELHGDPADRMLIAAATLHELRLATADEIILEYARDTRVFEVLALS